MSQRMLKLKKMMVMLTASCAAFGFLGLPGGDFLGGAPSCVSNANLLGFYQAVGDASIEAARDTNEGDIGSDWDAIVLDPSAAFLTGMYDSWIGQQIPADPIGSTLLHE